MDSRRINRGSWFVVRSSFKNTRNETRGTKHALTLIELLVAIAISTILGGATVLMLRSGLDAYIYGEEQALIQKVLDETLEEISGEGFRTPGIKDSLEILEAKEDSISFLPLWIDDSYRVTAKKQKFVLNRPLKLGSSLPILESRANDKEAFLPKPITFIPHQETNQGKPEDSVYVNEPLATGSQVRIIFQPDSRYFSDVIMRLSWDSLNGRFLRTYKNKAEVIPKVQYKGFRLIQARFQYFDNTNTEIPAPVPAELLSIVSGVRIVLSLESKSQGKIREASRFINLRNSHIFGKGIVIRKGMRIKIPDSHHIRTFNVGNIIGVKDKDTIQLKAQPQQGKAWRITIELGIKDGLQTIERYAIDYPAGFPVYSEEINLTCDLPFNLLNIGKNGRYDYDFDKDVENVVDLKGDVFLSVEEMTVQGAALFIRP